MKLSDIKKEDRQLDELLPALAAAGLGGLAGGALSGAAAPVIGGVATGVASGVAGAAASKAMGMAGLDPAQSAAAAKERNERKKDIQDAIQQKQQEINDLRKQLTQLG